MKTENKVLEMSFDFSLKIIRLYRELITCREFIISKQLLRSGTSIGANVEEAMAGNQGKILSPKCLSLLKKQEKQGIGCVYSIKVE